VAKRHDTAVGELGEIEKDEDDFSLTRIWKLSNVYEVFPVSLFQKEFLITYLHQTTGSIIENEKVKIDGDQIKIRK